ncbi:TetR/AcrR family transcriptional regulator [Bernardetia sp. Wsw4-3y2]|uniref:TetR/AcrR family transcriptional regulator n=1 Tax=Bernardetia sp. Wsw4-3y2 TaxID=3127471 RepID=UPI0030D39215
MKNKPNTSQEIKKIARDLFNKKGIPSVTLREVAKAMNKSYGNITYHFSTKEKLIEELYKDFRTEMQQVSQAFFGEENLFLAILKAPFYTFDISLSYLFFFKDYVFLLREYEELAQKINQENEQRKTVLKSIFMQLIENDIFRNEFEEKDMLYLMELSGAMRTFFFMQLRNEEFEKPSLKNEYVNYVNRLMFPYLSEKGRVIFEEFEGNIG